MKKTIFLPLVFLFTNCFWQKNSVNVGIIHSLTGAYQTSAVPVMRAELLAIEELNSKGGLLGKKINPIVIDGKSDWNLFKTESERLIVEEKVKMVVGCFASVCRKAVKPIFEKHNHLFIYPAQYEGLEFSKNIFYSGSTANQQIVPGVKWAFDNLGKKFFIVGTDSIYQRATSYIIRNILLSLGGSIVGEEYLLTEETITDPVARQVLNAKPEVIIDLLVGNTNNLFFNSMYKLRMVPNNFNVLMFKTLESEIAKFDNIEAVVGTYTAANYFQSLKIPENIEFIKKYQAKYGKNETVTDPMISAYSGIYLWAQAVVQGNSFEPESVIKNLPNQSFASPSGMFYVDSNNNHLWNNVYVGKVNKKGQFDIVWNSERPIRANPYPRYKTKLEWETYLDAYYIKWNQNWTNMGKK